jgi:hypothetical protein
MKSETKAFYDQFAFRVDKKKKKELMQEIGELTELLNSRLAPKFKRYRKNDVIIEALQLGFKSLRKKS